jgi:hypothetical protein
VEGRTRAGLIAAAVLLATIASAGAIEQNGTFALLGGKAKIVSKFWAEHGQGLSATLKVRQFTTAGKPILKYDRDMQHLMHEVIVRDDFRTFAHKHPSFDAATGTFSLPFTKAPSHKYYVYADSTPHGIGQQVFRFTIESDGPLKTAALPAKASSPDASAGPYTIILSKTSFPANTVQHLPLTVVKGDDPATDLVPYLGTPAHVVLIDVKTLQYLHVHPMLRGEKPTHGSSMAMGRAGPFMRLDLPPLPAGTYAAWVQIAGGTGQSVYTGSFTLVAR